MHSIQYIQICLQLRYKETISSQEFSCSLSYEQVYYKAKFFSLLYFPRILFDADILDNDMRSKVNF